MDIASVTVLSGHTGRKRHVSSLGEGQSQWPVFRNALKGSWSCGCALDHRCSCVSVIASEYWHAYEIEGQTKERQPKIDADTASNADMT